MRSTRLRTKLGIRTLCKTRAGFGQDPSGVASRFHLTSSRLSSFFVRIPQYHYMRKFLILPVLVSLAIICSCQKQDSAVEQDLAQRKMELEAREKALDERLNALNERVNLLTGRVNALADNQKAMANAGTRSADTQDQTSDPAQEQQKRERIQQLAAEMRARMADPSQVNAARAEKERQTQERRQHALEQLQGQKQSKSKMFNGAVLPAPQAILPNPPTAVEAASPNASPSVGTAIPTPSPTPQ